VAVSSPMSWFRAPALLRHPKRHASMFNQARQVVQVFIRDPTNTQQVADALHKAICETGGAHRKAAQQLAARSDVMPPEFCQALRDLFDNNPARGLDVISKQVQFGLKGCDVERVLKVGTIGEVSLVRPSKGAVQCIVKTISEEQKSLFETDFEMFGGGLMCTLNRVFLMLEKFSRVVNLVRPLLQEVVNIGSDEDFKKNTMDEFDLTIERNNMQRAVEKMHAASRFFDHEHAYFRVPKVFNVSAGKDVMLMEFMSGENLKDIAASITLESKKLIIKAVLEVFFHGLLCGGMRGGMLHADLHPGNLIWNAQQPGLAIVDWGLVVDIPEEHRADVWKLVHFLAHTNGEDEGINQLTSIFEALGVVQLPSVAPRNPDLEILCKFFDVVAGAHGQLNISEMLREMHDFQWPGWVRLWQKATGALVNTLVHLEAAAAMDLKAEVQKVLQHIGENYIARLPCTHCRGFV